MACFAKLPSFSLIYCSFRPANYLQRINPCLQHQNLTQLSAAKQHKAQGCVKTADLENCSFGIYAFGVLQKKFVAFSFLLFPSLSCRQRGNNFECVCLIISVANINFQKVSLLAFLIFMIIKIFQTRNFAIAA